MTKPNNPPAFPLSTVDGYAHDGISMRDYFAGQALAAMADCDDMTPESIAKYCYDIAQAMLAESEKRNGGGE